MHGIIIVGPAGAGKTTLGRLAARELGAGFLDIDDYIWRTDTPAPYTVMYSREEKIRLCEIVSASGADFIKTSTGFAGGGATREDVALFAAHVSPAVKIKAAGGISSLQDAADFLALGALRLGTSRIVKIVKEMQSYGLQR